MHGRKKHKTKYFFLFLCPSPVIGITEKSADPEIRPEGRPTAGHSRLELRYSHHCHHALSASISADKLLLPQSLGGSSPLCAIIISQLIRWVGHNTTKVY